MSMHPEKINKMVDIVAEYLKQHRETHYKDDHIVLVPADTDTGDGLIIHWIGTIILSTDKEFTDSFFENYRAWLKIKGINIEDILRKS